MDRILLKALGLMLGLAFAFWLPVGPARAAGGAPEARMTATVVEFQVRGGLDAQAGAIIADLMMSAIANTGRFVLRDRLPLSAAAKIAKASELGETGLLDPKTAAELGRLYDLEAVVTGGVYKLGDLITVTARLIDTKTASLLRSGQIQGKDIDTIQIKINELAAMITAPPDAPKTEVPKTYALTVKTDPADASVRLLNSPKPYQPGIQLAPGDHDIEVARPGYVTRKGKLRISDRDVTVTLTLEKAKYGLTIRPEPADAQVRLLDSRIAYQPGVALAPGEYEVEVAREGYVARKFPVRIVDGAVAVPVTLEKTPPPPPSQYRLTVQANPPQATVRLLDRDTPYQPGMRLPPGDYRIEIALDGYETSRIPVQIANSDVTLPVSLTKTAPPPPPSLPVAYRLTVQSDPSTAQVRLVDSSVAYQPGVALAPGRYTVEVTQSGYEPAWVTAQITDSDVMVPVKLTRKTEEPVKPASYRLTVRADPANARVRLLGIKAAYKPGVSLPPGNYTVEVSQAGYQAKRVSVRVADSDVTIPVTLVKEVEPERYRLTVRTDPSNARVRLVGAKTSYKSGVLLPPGTYTVEVSQAGYASQRTTARIVDGDVTLSVTLAQQPEPTQYRLTVQTDPPGAQVRLRGTRTVYRPGVLLPPGGYTVEVSQPGYETKQVAARIDAGDVTLPVTLVRRVEPTQYRLTVRADPSNARVRLVNSSFTYRPGVPLPSGDYTVEVTGRGYESKRVPVRIADGDVTLPVELERSATAPATAPATPPPSAPARAGEWRISAVNADGSLDGPDRSEFMRIFGGYVGRTVTRDTLLDGALRFYQSTGITLGFVVRTGASGTAELSGRTARRVRRSFESSIPPSMTRGQFQNSGFGVSVQ
jgi:hypothetical protein